MSKNGLKKKLEVLEQKISPEPEKTVILRMWCPHGKTTLSDSRRLRIEPSNRRRKNK
jgi:hypothetical protein